MDSHESRGHRLSAFVGVAIVPCVQGEGDCWGCSMESSGVVAEYSLGLVEPSLGVRSQGIAPGVVVDDHTVDLQLLADEESVCSLGWSLVRESQLECCSGPG